MQSLSLQVVQRALNGKVLPGCMPGITMELSTGRTLLDCVYKAKGGSITKRKEYKHIMQHENVLAFCNIALARNVTKQHGKLLSCIFQYAIVYNSVLARKFAVLERTAKIGDAMPRPTNVIPL